MDDLAFRILYQSIGIVALIIVVISFQIKEQKKVLIANGVASIFWSIHFFLTGAYSGVIINSIAIIRGFAFAFIKSDKWRIITSIILTVLLVGSGVVTVTIFNEIWFLAVITTVGSAVGTILFSLNSPKYLRLGQLFGVSPAWLFYNIWYLSIGGIIGETLNIVSVIVSLIRFRYSKKQDKKMHHA